MNAACERRLRLAAAAALVASLAVSVSAQEPSSAPAPVIAAAANLTGLSPRISLPRSTIVPGQTARVRFELWNTTGEVIEVPIAPRNGAPDAVGLPDSLIFGPEDVPALTISFEGEKAVPIRPETKIDTAPETTMRLGPHACVGAEIDLGQHHKSIRYSGAYRLEWRPFATLAAAAADLRVETRKDVVIVTDYGKITFGPLYDEAPQNVDNFLDLVRARFYDGKTFHRIVAGYLIQGGSPDGTNRGMHPNGRTVPAEFSNHAFDLGTVAMVRKRQDPNSASCQFMISLGRHPEWDGEFTVIGQIRDEESLRTLRKISELQTDVDQAPLKPVVMQFVTLVEADRATGRVETLGSP